MMESYRDNDEDPGALDNNSFQEYKMLMNNAKECLRAEKRQNLNSSAIRLSRLKQYLQLRKGPFTRDNTSQNHCYDSSTYHTNDQQQSNRFLYDFSSINQFNDTSSNFNQTVVGTSQEHEDQQQQELQQQQYYLQQYDNSLPWKYAIQEENEEEDLWDSGDLITSDGFNDQDSHISKQHSTITGSSQLQENHHLTQENSNTYDNNRHIFKENANDDDIYLQEKETKVMNSLENIVILNRTNSNPQQSKNEYTTISSNNLKQLQSSSQQLLQMQKSSTQNLQGTLYDNANHLFSSKKSTNKENIRYISNENENYYKSPQLISNNNNNNSSIQTLKQVQLQQQSFQHDKRSSFPLQQSYNQNNLTSFVHLPNPHVLPLSQKNSYSPLFYPQNNSETIFLKDFVFSLSNKIGQGSFASVYLGHRRTDPSQEIAVKVIDLSKQGARLREEIQISRKIAGCPHILKLLDFHIEKYSNRGFLFLEYCKYGSIASQIQNINRKQAIMMFREIIIGMKGLFQHSVIHRDLKLENILLDCKGSVRISDFGLSKQFSQDLLDVNSVKCGTPSTMAPEIFFAKQNYPKYDHKCDVWSLGVILHEIFYKMHPFGMDKEKLRRVDRVVVSDPCDIVESFLKRSLVKNPQDRIALEEVFSHQICTCDIQEFRWNQSPWEVKEGKEKVDEIWNQNIDKRKNKLDKYGIKQLLKDKEEKEIMSYAETVILNDEKDIQLDGCIDDNCNETMKDILIQNKNRLTNTEEQVKEQQQTYSPKGMDYLKVKNKNYGKQSKNQIMLIIGFLGLFLFLCYSLLS